MPNDVNTTDLLATLGGGNEPTHTLLYGDTGGGKSSGASTYPTPQLVCFFDPRGKERPYIVRTTDRQPKGQQTAFMDGQTPVQVVMDFHDPTKLVCRIEHYIDSNPRQPEAFARFLVRMTTITADVKALGIRTVILDSVTFMELAARKQQQYHLNPTARDPRQWFGGSTDILEEVLMLQLGAIEVNVVAVAHVDEEKDELHGTFVRLPAAPGRLSKRRGLPAGFSELYRAYVAADDKGKMQYMWQTRTNAQYAAASQIGAPNPCPQDYRALWLRGV